MKHISLFTFALSIPLAAFAAEPAKDARDVPVQLDRVEVLGDREKSLTIPSLEDSRATLALTPGGVEVVDSDRYLIGHASTLPDTFFLSPGVFAQSRSGYADDRISIRGSGLGRIFGGRGIRVMQDGVPINLADGLFDMMALEPTAAAYINIWRGGNALAYGGSTLGGAIDYVSRTGRNSPGSIGRLEIGSWNYLRATIAGGAALGSTDVYASFTEQSQDSFRDHAKHNDQRFFANAGVRLSKNIETRFFVAAIRNYSELPGSILKSELEADPQQAAAFNVALDQKRNFDLLRIANKTSFASGPDTTWNLSAAWTYKNLDHPIFQVLDIISNDALLGLNVENDTDLFGRQHSLRAGVLFIRGEMNPSQYTNNAGARGVLRLQDAQIASNLEAFAESQLSLGGGFTSSLSFAASKNTRKNTRLGTYDSLGIQIANPASLTYRRDFDNVSPKLGLRWDNAARDTQVYANVSGSYEPPSFAEAVTANTARDAQTATTYEIGTRGHRDFVRWDVTAYHSEIKDELLSVIDSVTRLSTMTNAERTTHSGLELGTDLDLLRQSWSDKPDHRLVFRTAWTYGRFEFKRHSVDAVDYQGNAIAGLPEHLIRGELLWENASGYYVGPTYEWVPSKTFVDHRNTLSADPYALVGFKLGRRVSEGLSWFVEARNLTNEVYTSTVGVIESAVAPGADLAQFYPGDGRSVYAGVEYHW